MGASLRDRATRPADQAPSGLGDTASVPSASAFTPGPWFVCGVRVRIDRQDWHAVSRYDEATKQDENIACVGFNPKTGVGLADARLIAAAPELYEALAELREAASRLIGAVLLKDGREILLAANEVNNHLPSSGKLLAKARGQ